MVFRLNAVRSDSIRNELHLRRRLLNELTPSAQKIVLQNAIAVLLLSVICSVGVIFWDRENQFNAQQRYIENEFDTLLNKVNAAVHTPGNLGMYVTLHGEITQSQLELFYKNLKLTEHPDQIPLAIQVAPNGIVTLEAPWTGGPHIGHDLFSDPQRKIEAIAAAQRLTSVIAGPLQLKQGGTALIVRHPILTDLNADTPEVWGLAIALLDWVPIAQRILEIEKSSGTELEVYIETLSGTRMAYPEISADATLPFDSTSTQFGLGSFHYSINARYIPSGLAILLISVMSSIFFLLVAAYRSREREQGFRLYEAAHKKSEGLLAAGTSAYTVADENFECVLISEEALKLFGYSDTEEAVQYISMYKNLTEDERQAQLQKLRALETGKILQFPQVDEVHTPDGRKIRIRRSSRWFPNPIGEGRLLWTNVDDVTELMNTHERLIELVDQDELTGLYSRRGLKERFGDGARTKTTSVYILDLDHFKSVNDCYGHEAGDELLRAIGQTMIRLTETAGCAARLGGEEFAIIRPWQGWDEAKEFGETLRVGLEQTVVVDGARQISRTASIGIAMLRADEALSDAMHLADHLAREAKMRGRNRVCAGEEEELRALELRGTFITSAEVQLALEAGEFQYYVQPIWNVEQKCIEGFEALIRWIKPEGVTVMPGLFIGVLYDVIREPKYLALKTQLRKDCLSKLSAFPSQYVSFNFTLEQLTYAGAAQDVHQELSTILDHPGRKIVIEISEQAMTSRANRDTLKAEIIALQGCGYKIGLDDFGVEASNLNRMQELPISILKIDKVLIHDIDTSKVQRATLRGLELITQSLGIKVIVEGIESFDQAHYLYQIGFYSHQGYLHARPMPPEDVEANLSAIGFAIDARSNAKHWLEDKAPM